MKILVKNSKATLKNLLNLCKVRCLNEFQNKNNKRLSRKFLKNLRFLGNKSQVAMSDEVKKFFNSLLQKINGLKAVIVSDRDGVPLLKLSKDAKFPELGTKQQFLATFSIATEQSSKMLLGKNKSIILMYKSTTVVQLNKCPLIITFVGTDNCNTGHILSLDNEIDKYLEEYKIVLEQNLI